MVDGKSKDSPKAFMVVVVAMPPKKWIYVHYMPLLDGHLLLGASFDFSVHSAYNIQQIFEHLLMCRACSRQPGAVINKIDEVPANREFTF